MKTFIVTTLALSITVLSFAQGPGHQPRHIPNHPRVNEVNGRIDNQERRINTERKAGELTKGQAQADRSNLKAINQEKHEMRSTDGGHLTKADQRVLNKQLNKNSRRIGY